MCLFMARQTDGLIAFRIIMIIIIVVNNHLTSGGGRVRRLYWLIKGTFSLMVVPEDIHLRVMVQKAVQLYYLFFIFLASYVPPILIINNLGKERTQHRLEPMTWTVR